MTDLHKKLQQDVGNVEAALAKMHARYAEVAGRIPDVTGIQTAVADLHKRMQELSTKVLQVQILTQGTLPSPTPTRTLPNTHLAQVCADMLAENHQVMQGFCDSLMNTEKTVNQDVIKPQNDITVLSAQVSVLKE